MMVAALELLQDIIYQSLTHMSLLLKGQSGFKE
jgi:hypothetical protein